MNRIDVVSELIAYFKQMDNWENPYDGDGWCMGCGSCEEGEHKPKCKYIHRREYLEQLNNIGKGVVMSDQNKNPFPELAGLWRSIIVPDSLKLDETLVSLIKQGKQVIHVTPIPNEFTVKEPAEDWKEESKDGKMKVATSVLVIYLEVTLKEEWLKTVRDNVVRMEDIK